MTVRVALRPRPLWAFALRLPALWSVQYRVFRRVGESPWVAARESWRLTVGTWRFARRVHRLRRSAA